GLKLEPYTTDKIDVDNCFEVLESYARAYSNMVRVQQLSELEEVIDYFTLLVNNSVVEGRRALIHNMWNERIKGTKRNVEELRTTTITIVASTTIATSLVMKYNRGINVTGHKMATVIRYRVEKK
ncbi:target of rapamycin, partial [Tanacetum coccineum]